ncbi:MAG: PspC domain-containing protein [Pseudomonadota bacterium]
MNVRSRVREEIGLFQRMRRQPGRGWIAGVCAGLAEFLDWNVKLIRLLFAAGFVFGGFFPAGVIYLVLWYLMEPDYGDGRVPPGWRGYPRRHWHAYRGAADGIDEPDDSDGPERYRPASPTELKVRFARLEERLRSMEACVTSGDFELRRELRKLES